MTTEELIAALEAAPIGARELGVAVLKAIGAYRSHDREWWIRRGDYNFYVAIGDETCVVCDLNFRLDDVPEGFWFIRTLGSQRSLVWVATLYPFDVADGAKYEGNARTERLARCIAELKAVLAMRDKA